MFVEHPWQHPGAMALDVKLLHPLEGVDTTLLTNSLYQQPIVYDLW